jgi:hypothetical protein
LLWLTVGKPPDRNDVRPVVGLLIAARIELTREIRVDMANMHLGWSPVFIFRAAIGEFRFLRRIW